MWLEENRSNILSDNPDFSDEADIIKEGMLRFRVLSTEERKVRIFCWDWDLSEFTSFKDSYRKYFFLFLKIEYISTNFE